MEQKLLLKLCFQTQSRKTTSSLNSVEVSDIIPPVVPGVTSGEGCSIQGGRASCPYMKMNSFSSLLTVCHRLPDEEKMLSSYKAERFKLQTPNGPSWNNMYVAGIVLSNHGLESFTYGCNLFSFLPSFWVRWRLEVAAIDDDSTAADKEEAFRRKEEGVLKGQELENALSDADYTKEVQIAFELCINIWSYLQNFAEREEPKEHRFAVIHGDNPKLDISIYSIWTAKHTGRVSKLTTPKRKQTNVLFWSPADHFIVLAGLKGFIGLLELYNVDEFETMATTGHFLATDIEWDPTGSFVATTVTLVHEMESGFNIWSHIAFGRTSLPINDFLWGPRAAAVVIHGNYFSIFSHWLFHVDKKQKSNFRSRDSDPRAYNSKDDAYEDISSAVFLLIVTLVLSESFQ
ncbi:hypothetical protein KIW84_061627 [Lathyrus oleraceus]|uniref:Translation initiation factor beta propellor-like domain-containing protein n=1 Tax=Pisum sativum TaxID=3888 RepID=A0A9D4W5J0_PEA|nr:hypothetical protein KIW84_061627 [Pisum sativum]